MTPTRRGVLRAGVLLGGLGGLAGCVADESPSADGTSREGGRSATETATETEPRSAERTPTERTPTEQPPTERTPAGPTRPDDTTRTERSTDPATDATTRRETSPESTVTPPAESSVRSVGGVRVAVTNPIARKAVAYESLLGSGGVLATPDRQFVVAAVRSASTDEFDAAAPPKYDAFSLVADGGPSPAVGIEKRTVGGTTASLAGRGDRGVRTAGVGRWPVGWIAFEPPSPLRAEDVSIRCQHGGETAAWPMPNTVVEHLGSPAPAFELRSFGAERTGSGVELSLVAANVSDVDGEFLAAVYWPTTFIADDDESFLVRREVAASDRIEWSKTVETRYTSGTVTARVDGVVTGEASVAVGTTTSG